MINTKEDATAVLQELMDEIQADPQEFWGELGWDVNIINFVAQAGVLSGMNNGSAYDLMIAMQMGAALALKGLEKKKNEPQPYSHLAPYD